jgi:AraC family transcriptional regulator of arabinose operon
MINLCRSAHPRRLELGLNALEEALLWCDSANPHRASGDIDPRVRKAMEFLTAHLPEPFSEKALGHASGLSPTHLRHLFRAQTGDSPRNFLEKQRLVRARELLAMSRLSVGEIAHELGFENPFYFTLRFKKSMGENPTAYRKRVLREETA